MADPVSAKTDDAASTLLRPRVAKAGMNDRTQVTIAQAAGGLGLAALLLYGGVAMGAADALVGAEAVLWSVVGLLLGAAAAWAFGRMPASSAARWASLVLTGVLPLATFLGWVLTEGMPGGLLAGILWLNLVAGIASLAAHGWMMSTASPEGSRGVRTTRV